jgi:hypothetical protein
LQGFLARAVDKSAGVDDHHFSLTVIFDLRVASLLEQRCH